MIWQQRCGNTVHLMRRWDLVRLVATSCVSLAIGVGVAAPAQPAEPATILASEASFLRENDVAMSRMMAAMALKPTGDVDRDFVNMMVPHHQGAIDMAVAVLRYGHKEQVRRLAQEIVVDQQQEIAAMRLAVKEPLPPSAAAPTMPADAPSMPSTNMSVK
jgi:hypothetical protein